MLEDYAKIQPEVQKEIQVQLEKFFAKKQKEQQFELSKIQNHLHSGTDAPKIPPSSVSSFIPVTSTPGGVFAGNILGGQAILANGQQFDPPIPQAIYLPPVPIIAGHGVGVDSQFNGGTALDGTMVYFNNLSAVNQLWIMVDGTWHGVDFPLT